MTTRRIASPLLVLLLALAACGVETTEDAGSDVRTETTTTDASTTTADDPTTTAVEDPTTTTEFDEPTTTFEVPSTLDTIPGGGDLDDAFRDGMIEGFEEGGLGREEAECMADLYLEEFSSPESSFPGYEELLDLFDQCGVDPSDFGG